MKIMTTSFEMFHTGTAALNASNPAAGHCRPMPLLETPGHSQASLCQSLVGSLLLSSGSWCTQGFVCALQESVSPVLCKFWDAKVGSQETPGVTDKVCLGVQNKTGQRLTEFCQENVLVTANTLFQQPKRRLYTWTSPGDQYQNQIDYILCS